MFFRMRFSLLLFLLLCGSSISLHAASMPAVHMKFVDAESNQPVLGAHILFQASAYAGTFTGHGGARRGLFLVEATTNDFGEIQLAAQDFWPWPFLFNTNYNNPSMIVFKPGYELVTLSNSRRIIAERQDVTTWQYANQTIKMQRSRTNKETYHGVYWAGNFAKEAYNLGGYCAWKNIPRFLVAVDHAVREWNSKRHAIQEEDLRRNEVVSPLRDLLGHEEFYIGVQCGSPKRFFDSYLPKKYL